ncbi:MAG: hypothetical protein M3Q58_02110 [Bacteroidota bacterium]|nr:hypothetical protein [Bacteroidota bacterium]
MIGEKANGKIIHFGCCSTLNTDGCALRRFLQKTKALAISGYYKDIDFVESTVFDLMCNAKNHLISERLKKA